MGIKVTCPDCTRAYNFKDELRGKKGRCKDCNGVLVIDDVDELDDVLDDSDDEDFELPVAPVRKKRGKKRRGSEMGQIWHAVSTNETLRSILQAVFGTAIGLMTFSVVCGFLLIQMCAGNWFGRPSFYIHMALLISGFVMILLCYLGAVIDATKDNPFNILVAFSPNVPIILFHILFDERYEQHREYLKVAIIWTACMFLSHYIVEPKVGWKQYRQNADDWWYNRIIVNPAPIFAAPAPVAVPQPAAPVPQPAAPIAANQPTAPVAQPQQPPPAAAPAAQPNRPFQRGQMILSTNIINYRGSRDAQQAAQDALRPLGWIDADNVQVDLQAKTITMPCRGGLVQGAQARTALEQAGFEVRGQSVRTAQ